MLTLHGLIDGASVVAQSTLTLACVLAICLALAAMPYARSVLTALVFCACFLMTALITRPLPPDALASSILLVLGIGIAAGIRLADWRAWLACGAGGVGAGIAGKMQTASIDESLGGLILVLAIFLGLRLILGVAPPPRLARAAALARRMAGAWIAAIGVLMLALWMRSLP